MKCYLKRHIIVMVAVVLQIGYCEHHDEDHVERIMRERDLRQPHEVKSKYKESRVGDEDHQNSVSFYILM